MNTQTSYPLTGLGIKAANDADYASPGEVGRIDRVCRIVAGMSVLMVLVSGMITTPEAMFSAAVVGCYLIFTTIVGLDPFYALVGSRLWTRFASVSMLTLGAVLSGQIYMPEVITLLGFVGAITGLAAIHHAGPLDTKEEVHPLPADVARGVGPVDAQETGSGQDVMASRDAA